MSDGWTTERVEELKRLHAEGKSMSDHLRQIQVALGLTSAQAAVVLRLWLHKGWAGALALQETAAPHMPGGRPWAAQQGIDAIRLKTGAAMFILGHADHGWALGEPGVRRVRAILEPAGMRDDA